MSLRTRIRFFRKLIILLLILLSTILSGTIGYMIIEDYTFLEGLYMTIITVSTVGFGEVHGLSEAGRIFTIALICINLALFTYFIALLTQYFTDGEFIKSYKRMKMEHGIQQLNNHVIICGFGRNGKQSAKILEDNGIPFVVIECVDRPLAKGAFGTKYYINGDATKDDVLLHAGITKAKALLSTLPQDTDNLFVVLSARQLNSKLTIISRASQDESIKKLKIAGADNIIMPDKIGGAHMASLVVLPDVVEMLSIMTTRHNAEFRVTVTEANVSVRLEELDLWRSTHCTLLGLKTKNEQYVLNPLPQHQIEKGDSLILMGSDEQIEKARKKLR
jgi:voltage-gated potassium channel